jgi:hypothetical protein
MALARAMTMARRERRMALARVTTMMMAIITTAWEGR